MSEIMCVCGHAMNCHGSDYCDQGHWDETCNCHLSRGIVEARYWARRMKRERDELQARKDRIVEVNLSDSEELILELKNAIKDKNDWQKEWQKMKAERDKIKAKAQEQSEIVQRDWASPAEKAGMEIEIVKLTAERNEQTRRLTLAIQALLEIASDYPSKITRAKIALHRLGLEVAI